MRSQHVIYGPGGYDPTKPNNNVIDAELVDVPDGPPTISAKALRSQLAAATTVAATKAVLAELVDALDPDHPSTVAP